MLFLRFLTAFEPVAVFRTFTILELTFALRTLEMEYFSYLTFVKLLGELGLILLVQFGFG